MTLYIAEGYAEVTWLLEADGDPEVMTTSLGVNATAIDNVGIEAAAVELGLLIEANLELDTAASISTDYTYRGFTWKGRSDTDEIEGEALQTLAGTGAFNPPPNNGAVLVRKNTGLAGRGNRGRMFWPPFDMDDDSVDARGILTSGAVSQRQGQWDDILTAVAASANIDSLALFHTITVANPTPLPAPITAMTVQSQLATQRRRMRP